jgi:hypothetical protein
MREWVDEDGHHWGACIDLPTLGMERYQRYAKFPRPPNPTDAVHGYPVSPRDHKRRVEHQPPPQIVNQWRALELITHWEATRISRGKL